MSRSYRTWSIEGLSVERWGLTNAVVRRMRVKVRT